MSQPVTPPPLVAPEAATSTKWGGAAIVVSFVLLISFISPVSALLTLGACFGTMMFFIGLEAEEDSEPAE